MLVIEKVLIIIDRRYQMSKSFQILMVLLLAFLPTLSKAENVSELPIVITSFDRIVSEKRKE